MDSAQDHVVAFAVWSQMTALNQAENEAFSHAPSFAKICFSELDDTHILYRSGDGFIIIDTPKPQPLKLVGSGQPEGKVIFAFA